MYAELLTYPLSDGTEAFSTQRDAVLPYPVVLAHQVHDGKVAVIDRPDYGTDDLDGYDALVTALPGVAIGVRTADCVPVLLHDPIRRVVAAIHAGWKGTVLRIAQKAVNLMEQQFLCKAETLRAVIGPSIGPASFQVGEEVAEHFKHAGFPMELIWSFQGTGDGSPMSGGHHIDLWTANRWLLEQAGLLTENIQTCGVDTYTAPAFYSARRESVRCGRIISAIRLV